MSNILTIFYGQDIINKPLILYVCLPPSHRIPYSFAYLLKTVNLLHPYRNIFVYPPHYGEHFLMYFLYPL